jgi:hypothetical protein
MDGELRWTHATCSGTGRILALSFLTKGSADSGRQWDLAPDRRFLLVNPGAIAMKEDSQPQMIVVLRWHEELKRLVPAK